MASLFRFFPIFFLVVIPAIAFSASDGSGGGTKGGSTASYENLPGKDIADKVRNNLVPKEVAENLPEGFLDGPKKDDMTYRMLRRLLGEPAVLALSYYDKKDNPVGGVTAVTFVIGLFPFIAIVISSIYVIYTLLVGMFLTTSTGELLGRRWDNWAMPVRSSLAVSLLFPVPPFSPFSGIQIVILWLALLGIGAAGAVYKAAVGYMVNTPLITVRNEEAPEFVHSIARSALCMAYLAKVNPDLKVELKTSPINGAGAPTILGGRNARNSIKRTRTQEAWRFDFGPEGLCGTVRMQPPKVGKSTLLHDRIAYDLRVQIYNAVVGSSGKRGIIARTFAKALSDVALPIIKAESDEKPLSSATLASRYNDLVESVQADLHAAAASAGGAASQANKKQLVDALSSFGFATAGTVYWSLSRRQAAFIDAVTNALPTVSEPYTGQRSSLLSWFSFANDNLAQMDDLRGYSFLDQSYNLYLRKYQPRGAYDEIVTGGGDNSVSWSNYISRKLSDLPRFFTDTSYENPDPLLEIKTLGHVLQNITVTLFALDLVKDKIGGWAGKVVTKVVDKIMPSDSGSSGGSSIGKGIGSIMGALFNVSIILGFLYANVIPAIPYLMWLTAIIGLLIFYMEALIASTFWIARKTDPEGEGFVGRAGAGYPIVLTLVLYPLLMVAGLVIGMAMVRIAGWFINITLWPFLEDMNSGGFNILSLFGNLVLFGVAYLIAVYKSFSLTYALPQAILRWMGVGAHFSDMGEEEAKNRMLNVSGVATRQLAMFVGAGKAVT